MPDSALVFDDRDELASFLVDGKSPEAIANYLLANQRTLLPFIQENIEPEHRNNNNLSDIAALLKSGNKERIEDCRNFLADCIKK